MVCKEDVLAWFKDLESYRRIDVMYELLNMCVPFEVRFIGTCIEEVGKHSYQELRGPAIIANDVEKLSKDSSLLQGVFEEHVRHRVLLFISLLDGGNSKCANWLFKNVFRTDCLEDYIVKGNFKDDNVQSELLLLFTMGLHHPAFSFEQKLFFGKMLSLLMDYKENRIPVKPSVFYTSSHPPGINVYPTQKITNVPEIPVKVALPMPMVDNTTVMHHGHPPGLSAPPIPSSSIELLTASLWSRPGFGGTVCGAPEVPPFPAPPISPLVSQSDSPIQSRSTSPHRTTVRPPPPPVPAPPLLPNPIQPPLDSLTTQLPMDAPLSLSSRPIFNSDTKISDEEVNHLQDDKFREAPWPTTIPIQLDPKPINGMRFTPYSKPPPPLQQPFLIDQMQSLNLDSENNPSSSGGSHNSSPAETPTIPHGPGRGGGDSKQSRMNGVPPFQQQQQQQQPAPLCDATSPPPSLPPMANCSVPYSYPTHVPLPSRTLFQYAQQAYRAPFTATPAHPYPYQPTDNNTIYTSLTVPYPLSYMYSSNSQQVPTRNINCYNCGAPGHLGNECTGQTIEDITQKAYQLEYSSPLPDVDK